MLWPWMVVPSENKLDVYVSQVWRLCLKRLFGFGWELKNLIAYDSYVLAFNSYFLKTLNDLNVVYSVECFGVVYESGLHVFINI